MHIFDVDITIYRELNVDISDISLPLLNTSFNSLASYTAIEAKHSC